MLVKIPRFRYLDKLKGRESRLRASGSHPSFGQRLSTEGAESGLPLPGWVFFLTSTERRAPPRHPPSPQGLVPQVRVPLLDANLG